MARKLELTRTKIKNLAELIQQYPQQEAAARAGIVPRSFSRYKSLGREVFDKLMDQEIEDSDLTKEEKLLLEFFIAVDSGVPLHVGKYYKIMRDTAHGSKYVMDEDGNYVYDDRGNKLKTDWVAAKEYAHMLTFATKESREGREQELEQMESGVIEVPAAPSGVNLSEFFKQQQASTQSLSQAKRKENGDGD